MSLLGKLFGDEKKAESALDFLKNMVEGKEKEAQQAAAAQPVQEERPSYAASEQSAAQEELAPAGTWWGDRMPAEENQFSYPGPYQDYFAKVYAEEFPQYRIEQSESRYNGAPVFTFWEGDRKALVTEILGSSSSAQKLRRDCASQGIPYLRYYHDHHGWWNARSYIVNRTKGALGI